MAKEMKFSDSKGFASRSFAEKRAQEVLPADMTFLIITLESGRFLPVGIYNENKHGGKLNLHYICSKGVALTN